MANQHSQTAGSKASVLIDATIEAFDMGQAATTQEGLSLVNDWFSSLKTQPLAEKIVARLMELKEELQADFPNNQRLKQLLISLADLTDNVVPETGGEYPSRLTSLATALRNFAGQLSAV